jgi:hypothetical protein
MLEEVTSEKLGMLFTDIVGYTDWNGYLVSTNGKILNKNGTDKSYKINSKGYLFTNFYYKGRAHCHLIHTVVWMAFKGSIPKGYEVDHINNNRKDCNLNNLQLLTKSQNNQKSYDSGNRNFLFGQTNPNSLTRKIKQ